VKITKVDFEALKSDVDQLWAEAVHRANEGESHELNEEQTAEIKKVQEEKSIVDPWQELIVDFLADKDGKIDNCRIRGDTIFNLLDVKKERRTQAMLERVGGIMLFLGFRRKKSRFGGKSLPGYSKGTGENEKG
jgi:putative DNA primase/helicase